MEELEKAIADVLQKSQLPLEAKRYVLKHLYGVIDLNYQLALEKAERERINDNGGSDRADR